MKTCKLFIQLCIIMFCLSCSSNSDVRFLKGTKWKLAGLVDTQTGELEELEPKSCDTCYSFTFDTDNTAFGNSITNYIGVFLIPELRIIVLTEAYDYNVGDAANFYDAIQSVVSYDLKKNELKFYYNENKNYLLFNRIE